jgi:hypothetical protein
VDEDPILKPSLQVHKWSLVREERPTVADRVSCTAVHCNVQASTACGAIRWLFGYGDELGWCTRWELIRHV